MHCTCRIVVVESTHGQHGRRIALQACVLGFVYGSTGALAASVAANGVMLAAQTALVNTRLLLEEEAPDGKRVEVAGGGQAGGNATVDKADERMHAAESRRSEGSGEGCLPKK
jgi:hypothetical protein